MAESSGLPPIYIEFVAKAQTAAIDTVIKQLQAVVLQADSAAKSLINLGIIMNATSAHAKQATAETRGLASAIRSVASASAAATGGVQASAAATATSTRAVRGAIEAKRIWAASTTGVIGKLGEATKSQFVLRDATAAASKQFAAMGLTLTATQSKLGLFHAALMANMRQFASIGRVITFSFTVPFAMLAGASTKAAADFDANINSMVLNAGYGANNIREAYAKMGQAASSADITREIISARDHFSKLAQTMSLNSLYSATEISSAMLDLAKGGLTAIQIEGAKADGTTGALAATLRMAAADGMKLDEAAKIVITTMSMFNINAEQATKVTDVLAAASMATVADISSLAAALKYVGSTAASAGVSLEDTVTFIALLQQAGLSGTTAGTSLNQFFAELQRGSSTTGKANDALRALGVSAYDSSEKLKAPTQLIKELSDATKGMTDQARQQAFDQIFQIRGIRVANLVQSAEAFEKLRGEITQSGVAADMARARMEGSAGALKMLQNSANVAAIVFGKALAPTLGFVAGVVRQVTEWFASLTPQTQQYVAAAMMVVAVGGPLIWIFAQLAVAINALEGPLGWVTLALMTVASVAGYVAANNKSLTPEVAGLGQVMSDAQKQADEFASSLGTVGGAAGGAGAAMQKGATEFEKFVASAKRTFYRLGKDIAQSLIDGTREMLAAVEDAGRRLTEAVASGSKAALEIALEYAGAVRDGMQTAYDKMVSDYTKIKNFVIDTWKRVKEQAQSHIDDLIAKIADLKKEAADFSKSLQDSLKVEFTESGFSAWRREIRRGNELIDNLKKLREMGLNETTIQQIISAGVSEGRVIARSILRRGTDAVQYINDAQAKYQENLASLTDVMASDRFGDQISAAESALTEAQRQFEEIAKAADADLKRIIEIGKQFGVEVDAVQEAIDAAQADVDNLLKQDQIAFDALIAGLSAGNSQTASMAVEAWKTAAGALSAAGSFSNAANSAYTLAAVISSVTGSIMNTAEQMGTQVGILRSEIEALNGRIAQARSDLAAIESGSGGGSGGGTRTTTQTPVTPDTTTPISVEAGRIFSDYTWSSAYSESGAWLPYLITSSPDTQYTISGQYFNQDYLSSLYSMLSLFGGMAVGGDVFSNRAYMVGEHGPELFVPKTSGTIVPNDKTNTYMSGSNNITVNAVTNANAHDIGREIAWALKVR